MPRPFTPKVVTANALLEGDVIYFAADGCWVRDLSAAEALTDQDQAEARLALAAAGRHRGRRLSGRRVELHETTPRNPPISAKSSAVAGPSNYAHGKQVADPEVEAHVYLLRLRRGFCA